MTTKSTPAKKTATAKKATTAKVPAKVTKALNDLEAAQARIVEISAELEALRATRAKALIVARDAGVSYTSLSKRMGDIPTGNIFAMVKAATA